MAAWSASGALVAIVLAQASAVSTCSPAGTTVLPMGVESLAQEHELLHEMEVHMGPPPHDAEPGEQADGRLRRPELGGLVGDDEVGHHRQLAPSPEGVAVHGGDGRLGEVLERLQRDEAFVGEGASPGS